jgi:long-subunit fatty acid transport protein
MLAGVSVPVGSWVLGATVSQSITSGVSDVDAAKFPNALFKAPMSLADGTGTGYSLGAKYNLSKRTNLSLKYASWVRSGYEQFEAWGARVAAGTAAQNALNEFGYSERATETSILLSHSF